METLKITKQDLNANNENNRNEYIGKTDVTNFDGNIEIDESLAGSGIEAVEGIRTADEILAR
jgi:hypothetical protein